MNSEIDDDNDDDDHRSSPASPCFPRHRSRSFKSSKTFSLTKQIHHEEISLPTNAMPGDIIQLEDGTRKKYNGSSWRRMCSKPNCSHYTQSQGLCKPHLAVLKKRKISKNDQEMSTMDQTFTKQNEPKKGDIITLLNGIRKKYDGRQYRRVCAKSNCTTVVHGSLEYQNGLCPHHYHEYRAKGNIESSPEHTPNISLESFISPMETVICSSSSSSPQKHFHSNSNSKTSIPRPNRRLSIAVIPSSVNIENPKKGDVIEMTNGSRKKFDGVVWRTICSIPDCFIAAQRNELCRKHFIKLNGKHNSAPTMVQSTPTNSTSSINDKSDYETKQINEESRDYDDHQLSTTIFDPPSNISDDEHIKEDNELMPHIDEQIDHIDINALSVNREKFQTIYLKNWLREHRAHPYPSHHEKTQLANQSSITYDQVTTWFNNARAILRRRQAKLRPYLEITEENQYNDSSFHKTKQISKNRISTTNNVYHRSIGVQCNPSTVDQCTITSTESSMITNDELLSDRTIRILSPSSNTKNSTDQILISNRISNNRNEEQIIILTTTCLDEEQMNRMKEFCTKFHIESSNIVDEHTTHLITDEENGETLVCPLSKKVIQAIARHMFIVTYRWIDACLKANRLLDEKPFEIQGDLTLSADHHGMQRSRQSVLPTHLPTNFLLENFSIILKCNGCQEMMNNDELIELVQLSGAKYTTNSYFSRSQTGITRIVLCEKEYLKNRREMYEKCIQAGIHFLTPEWFLETLVQYRIQPFQEYQISP